MTGKIRGGAHVTLVSRQEKNLRPPSGRRSRRVVSLSERSEG